LRLADVISAEIPVVCVGDGVSEAWRSGECRYVGVPHKGNKFCEYLYFILEIITVSIYCPTLSCN
jgi:hypothetical protein